MHATLHLLTRTDFPPLRRRTIDTLQLNLGYRCNQSCLHCHVNAGPTRKEEMTAETIAAVIAFIAASPDIRTIDLTGGAPELNPEFRNLVVTARARGLRVIDRCNLTILEQPGFADMADFLATHKVEIVASLPWMKTLYLSPSGIVRLVSNEPIESTCTDSACCETDRISASI